MTEPYRTPPEIIQLEQQLRDKSEECEDLRRERDEFEDALRTLRENDNQNAREWWTWRLGWLLAASVALALIYAIWTYNMKPEAEGACREILLADHGGLVACPYGGQIATPVGDRIKCTCPTAAPAGSAR